MNDEDVVMGRRSIRSFKLQPFPRQVIEEIIELAIRTSSSMNTQPWHLHAITGTPLARIRAGNTERNLARVPPSREGRGTGVYEGEHRLRQLEIAVQLFQAMDIERDDAKRLQDWVLRVFRQFDAPISVVICYDRVPQGGDIARFDCGAVLNGLVNAAWCRGGVQWRQWLLSSDSSRPEKPRVISLQEPAHRATATLLQPPANERRGQAAEIQQPPRRSCNLPLPILTNPGG